jgi:ABC-type transporter Mla subunit MlaD
MSRINSKDLTKIGSVALIGFLALVVIIFWLKGHKIHNYERFTVYFKNVNGLEEGNALRWNGLKIGVVESIEPVRESFEQDAFPADALLLLGKRHMEKARQMLSSDNIEDIILAQEAVQQAQMEIALGRAGNMQSKIKRGEYVAVTAVITTKNVPIGSLNQVTIVPSGLIGEQYLDLSTINVDAEYRTSADTEKIYFVVLEPIRLDAVIRANAESAEAITNLSNRLNVLFSDKDAENISELIKSVSQIASDKQLRNDLKSTASNLNKLTKNFKIWKLF